MGPNVKILMGQSFGSWTQGHGHMALGAWAAAARPPSLFHGLGQVILHRVPLIGFPNMAYHIPSWEIMGNHGKSWEILAMAGSAASAASTASPHPSIKESTKGGGAKRRLLYGWVWGGQNLP